jgi:putative ABC transport system permease protein
VAGFFAEPVIVLLDSHADGQANGVKLALEASYLNSGMEAIDTRAIIEEASRATLQVFVLIEVFMGLGLVVGIAGLGIVMLRNVRERRQHIGVLRAIGFQTRMVLNAFVVEASFISILGMAVGLTMGLVVAYELWDDFFRPTGALFIVAWEQLALIIGMTYLATTFSALGPALRASRMAPAEALRSVD